MGWKLTFSLSRLAYACTSPRHAWGHGGKPGIAHRGLGPSGAADCAGDGSYPAGGIGIPEVVAMPWCADHRRNVRGVSDTRSGAIRNSESEYIISGSRSLRQHMTYYLQPKIYQNVELMIIYLFRYCGSNTELSEPADKRTHVNGCLQVPVAPELLRPVPTALVVNLINCRITWGFRRMLGIEIVWIEAVLSLLVAG